MDSFPGLEFESDILSDIDFGLGSGGMGGMIGTGLDSPGNLPFSVGTPTGIASLGSGAFPGMHNNTNSTGQSNTSTAQTNPSGTNSDMNRDDGRFHDDDGMFFGSDMGKEEDKTSSKPPSVHPHHSTTTSSNNNLGRGSNMPNNNNPPHMSHEKPNNQSQGGGPSANSMPHHQSSHLGNNSGGRKDSVSDTRPHSNGGGPSSNNPTNPNAPKGVPGGGGRISESNTELLSSLLLPDNSGPPMNMGIANPNTRPQINQGSNNGPGPHNINSHYGQPTHQQQPLNYGQGPPPPQQRGNLMMGSHPGNPSNMYGGYNPSHTQNRPPQTYQAQPQSLQRTSSMPGGQLIRQSSALSTGGSNPFPTNYDEELAKLKSMLSAQPDLIPPPQEILRVTQQLCMANMQRLQQQQHPGHPVSGYMQQPPHIQANGIHMPGSSPPQMPPGYPPSGPPPPTRGGPMPNQPHMSMDHRQSLSGASMSSGNASVGVLPSRPGVSPASVASVGQQNPPANNQMVAQQPGGANKSTNVWQSESDVPLRRKMIAKIVSLLQQRKPDAPTEWIRRLPDMARRLEDSLYRTATGREVYGNFNTLKSRLQHLAVTMGARAAKGNDPNSPSESTPAPSGAPALMGSNGPPPPQQQHTGPNGGVPPPNAAGRPGGPPGNMYNPSQGTSQQPNGGPTNGRMSQQMQLQMQSHMQQRQGMANNNAPGGLNKVSPGAPPNSNPPPPANPRQNSGPPQANTPAFRPNNASAMQQQQQRANMYANPPPPQQPQNPRVASPGNTSMRNMSTSQPPATQRSTSISSARLSDALGDMDSTDFLDLGMGDDGTDLGAEDPIDALMRGSNSSTASDKDKRTATPSASPKPDPKAAAKRPMPAAQQDSQAAKRAKAPAKRTPRNNSASPPVVKTPPPSGTTAASKQPPTVKTPPPPPPVNK
ncbi:hypothetical protein H310_10817 [Aphanomyces invadans]|uniref:Mediator complex subunit 15 KIX domain-containing protein n=1 Tax=Aphanomyces invadans TaxID=157072 RepID=A0A024TNM1_9STRA|nr:hypothetical protein H310_10817 [Aphanomyces invadans]ETV95745.1 hypothetical protein H310_10817 [Aphanomyces invadans]|eukprot:XP_008875496.1 hypothetical protein H310_10817 [Aphanomyces invadans]